MAITSKQVLTRWMGAPLVVTAVVLSFIAGVTVTRAGAAQEPPTVAVLVRADNPVDAFSASAVAAQLGGAVFLTESDALTDVAAEGIRALDPDLVLLAGGTNALSEQIEADVAALGYGWERLAGETRLETAQLISGLLQRFEVARPVIIRADGSSSVDLAGLSVLGLPFEYTVEMFGRSGGVIVLANEYTWLNDPLTAPEARFSAHRLDGTAVAVDARGTIEMRIRKLTAGSEVCAQLYDFSTQEFIAGSEMCVSAGQSEMTFRRLTGASFSLPDREMELVVATRISGGQAEVDGVQLRVGT